MRLRQAGCVIALTWFSTHAAFGVVGLVLIGALVVVIVLLAREAAAKKGAERAVEAWRESSHAWQAEVEAVRLRANRLQDDLDLALARLERMDRKAWEQRAEDGRE